MKIGFIGCGKMGSALIQGVLEAKVCQPEQVTVYDRVAEPAEVLGTEWRKGPPGFTNRETDLDTIAMVQLADSIRWDRVVLMWIAMHPTEHDRLEGLVS
jgi:pyrroline-5-carboxylate reductase